MHPYLLVTDTNIWIDLKNGGILSEVFNLPFQFISPDLAQSEYGSVDWIELETYGLTFFELLSIQMAEVYSLKTSHRGLSIIDLSSLIIAENQKAGLITGDNGLRRLAIDRNCECHGVLWLLDKLLEFNILLPKEASRSLELMIINGARLPEREVIIRQENWNKS